MNQRFNFSIIVPTYNSEKYIETIIKDFINFNLIDIELIIVDDGSTDKTKDICLKNINDNIHYYYKCNGGPSSARNYGLTKASGEYIAFIDSDDKIKFDKLYKNFKYMQQKKLDLLIIPFIEDKYNVIEKQKINKIDEISRLIISEEINSPCNKIYKNKIIQDNNIKFNINYDLGEDLLFNIDYYNNSYNMEYSNIRYYHYVKRVESLTTKYRENKIYALIKLNNELLKKCEDLKFNTRDSIYSIRIKNFYSCLKDIVNINKKLEIKLNKIKELKIIFDCKKVYNIKYEILRKLFILLPSYFLYIVSLILFRKRK